MATKTFFGILPGVKLPIETDEFRISEGLAIERIPAPIKDICSGMVDISNPFFAEFIQYVNLDLKRTEWCLTSNYEVPDIGSMDRGERSSQITKNQKKARITILNLSALAAIKCRFNLYPKYFFKGKPDGTNPIYESRCLIPPRDHFAYRFWHPSIEFSELEELGPLFPAFIAKRTSQKGQKRRYFVAVNLLHLAMLESGVDIALVLLVTCLESLLLDSHIELGHKLASRTTWFLGKNKSYRQREAIYTNVKKAYTIRGQVVHGPYIPINDQDLARSYMFMRGYVCDVLLRFLKDETVWKTLESEKKYKNFLKRLDLGEPDPLGCA